jgi:hypothetical protein
MKMPTTSDVLDVISGLLALVLVGCGAWYWYNSNVQALGTKQIAETAVLEIRETAECPHGGIQDVARINGSGARNSGGVHGPLHGGAEIRLPSRLHRENARRRPCMEPELQV